MSWQFKVKEKYSKSVKCKYYGQKTLFLIKFIKIIITGYLVHKWGKVAIYVFIYISIYMYISWLLHSTLFKIFSYINYLKLALLYKWCNIVLPVVKQPPLKKKQRRSSLKELQLLFICYKVCCFIFLTIISAQKSFAQFTSQRIFTVVCIILFHHSFILQKIRHRLLNGDLLSSPVCFSSDDIVTFIVSSFTYCTGGTFCLWKIRSSHKKKSIKKNSFSSRFSYISDTNFFRQREVHQFDLLHFPIFLYSEK